jgi:hypothetical protein
MKSENLGKRATCTTKIIRREIKVPTFLRKREVKKSIREPMKSIWHQIHQNIDKITLPMEPSVARVFKRRKLDDKI